MYFTNYNKKSKGRRELSWQYSIHSTAKSPLRQPHQSRHTAPGQNSARLCTLHTVSFPSNLSRGSISSGSSSESQLTNPLEIPPVLAPSVEEAYRRKCIQLKQRLIEIEADNEATRIRVQRIERSIQKQRIERAFLLEQLAKRTSTNVEDSEGSPSPPPTVWTSLKFECLYFTDNVSAAQGKTSPNKTRPSKTIILDKPRRSFCWQCFHPTRTQHSLSFLRRFLPYTPRPSSQFNSTSSSTKASPTNSQ